MHGSSLRDRDNPTTKASRRSVQGVSASCCMLLSQRGLLFAGLSYLVSLGFFWWFWWFLFICFEKVCYIELFFLTFLPEESGRNFLQTTSRKRLEVISQENMASPMVPTLLSGMIGNVAICEWKAPLCPKVGRRRELCPQMQKFETTVAICFGMLHPFFAKDKIITHIYECTSISIIHGFMFFDLAYFQPPY